MSARVLFLLTALACAQEPAVRTESLPLVEDIWWDLDAATVLSRERVGPLQADVVLTGEPLRLQLCGGARWIRAVPRAGARLDATAAALPVAAGESLLVATDQGARALVLLPAERGQPARVIVRHDGGESFAAGVEGLRLRYTEAGALLVWEDDAPARIWQRRDGHWLTRGTGTGSFALGPLHAPTRIAVARLLPDGTEALPVGLTAGPPAPLRHGVLSLPDARLELGDTLLASVSPMAIRAGPGVTLLPLGDGPLAWFGPAPPPSVDGLRVVEPELDEVFALRTDDGRSGRLWFRPEGRKRLVWRLGDAGERGPGPTAWRGEPGAEQVTLRWRPAPGAAAYRVYAFDPERGFRQLAELPGPPFALPVEGPLYWHDVALSAVDGTGRESWPRRLTVAASPDGAYRELRLPGPDGACGWSLRRGPVVARDSCDLFNPAPGSLEAQITSLWSADTLFPPQLSAILHANTRPASVATPALAWFRTADSSFVRMRHLGNRGDTLVLALLPLRFGLREQLAAIDSPRFRPHPAELDDARAALRQLDATAPEEAARARSTLESLGPRIIDALRALPAGSAQRDRALGDLLERWLQAENGEEEAPGPLLVNAQDYLFFPERLPPQLPLPLHEAPLTSYTPGERARYRWVGTGPHGADTAELVLELGEEGREVPVSCTLDGEERRFRSLLRGTSAVDWLPPGRKGWLDLRAVLVGTGYTERDPLPVYTTWRLVEVPWKGGSLPCLRLTVHGRDSHRQLVLWYNPTLPVLGLARLSSRVHGAAGRFHETDLTLLEE